MDKPLKLRRGQQVTLSIRGHNNFIYPSGKTISTIKECSIIEMAWVGSAGMKAYRMPVSAIYPNYEKNKEIIIWINKNNL